jgi:hypothetical protein
MTKDITIVAVDTYAHELTRLAIERTLAVLPCQEVLVLSDKNIYPDGRWVDINPIDIVDYNTIMIKNLWPFVRTEHILVVQYDGMATNPEHWSDDFLNYDYIGAVWPFAHHPVGFRVGNGGFSLRSRNLINALKDKNIIQHPQLPMYEDLYIGVHYKEQLVNAGMKIADEDVANRFSHEHPPGLRSTFGFHGTFNIPYYFNDADAENFVRLMTGRTSEGSLLMVEHFFLADRPELGKLALELGCKAVPDFKDRVKSVIGRAGMSYKLAPLYSLLT